MTAKHKTITAVIMLGVILSIVFLPSAHSQDQNTEISGPTKQRYIYHFDSGPEVFPRTWVPEPVGLPTEPEMYEVTQYPFAQEPTQRQRKAADRLIQRSLAAAKKNDWYNFDRALEDGYLPMFDEPEATHYRNATYVCDGRTLDPQRPEFLMYWPSPTGKKLVGYMFVVSTPMERGPQVGGPLTVWHYHILPDKKNCWLNCPLDNPSQQSCEPTAKTPEMLHVWFIDHPEGPFATRMDLPEEFVQRIGGTSVSHEHGVGR